VTRLLAPSLSASTHITLGGQSIAVPTSDGKLLGKPVHETVRETHGVYSFDLPKASAALLKVG
jgi:hypothetical protein